jgi:phospholipid/cholesterol/gamma-HCH transport system ATP-binding protein
LLKVDPVNTSLTTREESMDAAQQIATQPPTAGEGENAPAVAVEDLHKSFGTQNVLNGVSLNVNRGETLAVLGRSGTGKSVLLRIIIGLQEPDSGSVRIHGQEITGLSLDQLGEIRKKMGFLFQHAALYDSLTVEQNVAFPLQHHKKEMSKSEQSDRARHLLAEVGMDGHFEKMPSDISGGMQKRVGLARALALDPDVLLLDEPTAGLDPISSAEIDELVLKLQEEHHMASVVVTHDLHSAKTIADRLALLDKAKVVIEGSFEDLQKSDIEFVKEFLKHS